MGAFGQASDDGSNDVSRKVDSGKVETAGHPGPRLPHVWARS